MKSLDVVKAELQEKLSAAMKSEDPNAITTVLAEFAGDIHMNFLNDFKTYQSTQDQSILSRRGVRQLTADEKKFYETFAAAAKSDNPKMEFTGLDGSPAMPTTIIDTVLEDLKSNFPLLAAINIQNTATITKMVVNKMGTQLAIWGALNSTITKELSGAIGEIDVSQNKLTAFMAISRDMLDAGPEWMDAYVRAVLVEANGGGLCKGMTIGTGKNEPIGMVKDVSDGVAVTNGVYPDKATIAITDLSPQTIGSIAATIATGPNSRARVVPRLLLVVNPVDYFQKIMPATTYLTPQGTYVNNVLPYPSDIVQDVNVPSNKAIFGLASRYFMGVGKGVSGGTIEYSDEFKFLDDQRVYKTKLYGNGRPLDNNAFVIADITNLKALTLPVSVANETLNVVGVNDARLASLSIGSLTLSPSFNKSVMNYTTATTNATNIINVTAMDGEATMVIDVGGTAVANGSAATWAAGENIVTITVTSGTETETYTVTVTKS